MSLPRVFLFLLSVLLLPLGAQEIPGMFILEMDEPARAATRQAFSQTLRLAIEQARGEVIHSIDNVMNAVVVRMPHDDMAALATLPGVSRVYRVYEMKLELDSAVRLAGGRDAWTRIGGHERAGAGIKIGIIDTGINPDHPGFHDDSLSVPQGFPKGNRESDLGATSSKVIVARSYENLLDGLSEPNPRDQIGHGTGVAMAAAGILHKAPFGEISGVAPKAFLGNYKVFAGASGGSTRSDVVIRAIDDAVSDGMDVINISLGILPAPRPEEDATVRAVERAAQAGVIVVKSAGNSGPNPNTTSSPSGAPSIISVGSHINDRLLISTFTVADLAPIAAIPAAAPLPVEPLTAPLADVASLDRDGQACLPFPASSLAGKVALILRGTCTFEEKLNNANRAGALGAIVYTDDRPPSIMSVGEALLPAMMISNPDGVRVKAFLAENAEPGATLRFQGAPFPLDFIDVSPFSSRGPSDNLAIQPDLLAVGEELYTAAQDTNRQGEVFDPSGYAVVDGTSFASPIVAGGAALVKAARPGLTQRQYRSLLINAARPIPLENERPTPVQQAGAGILNLATSLDLPAAVFPASLSFGAATGSTTPSRQLTITNLGTAADTFTITPQSFGDGPTPEPQENSFPLAPGSSKTIEVRWPGGDLPSGAYQGILSIRGTFGDAAARVPYWHAIINPNPGFVTFFNVSATAGINATTTFRFRISDPSGVTLREIMPEVTVVSGGGSVESIDSIDHLFPGLWQARVRLGPSPSQNIFQVKVGEIAFRAPPIRGN
ncbi:MAG: hypothetical protein FJW20_11940 [Acidimicrobiia bacterium]|nr:hypothetical protein [Acidimicrobiia bacterium]